MKQFIKSLFTDGEWDGDVTKVFGVLMICAGVAGWLWKGYEPAFIIGFGSALAASGKFSKEG